MDKNLPQVTESELLKIFEQVRKEHPETMDVVHISPTHYQISGKGISGIFHIKEFDEACLNEINRIAKP